MTELLAERDAIDAAEALSGVEGTYERAQLERSLRREVAGMWGSDELRRSKPTPQKEARGGLAVLETALWDAVPGYVRRLDAVVAEKCGAPLPLGAAPVVFASWMGGDRDGNPNVTAQVTREVVAAQRRQAAALYLSPKTELRQYSAWQTYLAPSAYASFMAKNPEAWTAVINTATTYGIGNDNPASPYELTPQQAARSVMVEFVDVSSFQVRYAIGACCTTGRNFLFAGYSGLHRPLCPFPPAARSSSPPLPRRRSRRAPRRARAPRRLQVTPLCLARLPRSAPAASRLQTGASSGAWPPGPH